MSLYQKTGVLLTETLINDLLKDFAFFLVHIMSESNYIKLTDIEENTNNNTNKKYIPKSLTEERILVCLLAEHCFVKRMVVPDDIYNNLSLITCGLTSTQITIKLLEKCISSLDVDYSNYWMLGLSLYNNKQYDKSLIILSKCIKFMEESEIRNEVEYYCPSYLPSILCSNIYLYYYLKMDEGIEYIYITYV